MLHAWVLRQSNGNKQMMTALENANVCLRAENVEFTGNTASECTAVEQELRKQKGYTVLEKKTVL